MNSSVNAYNVGMEFMRLLKENLELEENHPITSAETLVAEQLLRKFSKLTCHYVVLDEDENIFTGDDDLDTSFVDDDGSVCVPIYDDNAYVPFETKVKLVKLIEKNPNWKFKTLRSKCSAFKQPCYKQRWIDQVKNGGSRYDKLVEIDAYVYGRFKEAREDCKIVHDLDIRRWALQYAQVIPNFSFKASPTWLVYFKRRHGIGSRKIQRVVSKREVIERSQLLANSELYRNAIKKEVDRFSEKYIWSTDQTGVEYEMIGARTLSFRGERMTYGFGYSPKNAATHSYTVQPIISMAGDIVGNFYVCLQETGGKMGPRIKQSLFNAPNLTVTCSASGKLTKTHVAYFLDNVVKPNASQDFLLTFDSFSGQKDPDLYDSRFGVEGVPICKTIVVPEKCTAMVQALDTGFNRQFKYFIRAIYDYAALHESEDTECRLTSRNDVLKTVSLAHFILSAPKFKGMIRNCWVTAGMLEENEEPVVNVRDACFTNISHQCVIENCMENTFIVCSWCDRTYCFSHFYRQYHLKTCDKSPLYKAVLPEGSSNIPDPEVVAFEKAMFEAEEALKATEVLLSEVTQAKNLTTENKASSSKQTTTYKNKVSPKKAPRKRGKK
ncbi:unnamed protein product [Allacma fusca]|uniref:HTH CENPB-type domain-containing protein n=1 Tax=Allacma fusca TaxID=39272 RepID=A0A8J2PK48_9HEXA|nr:unnamed protein product [Allacma fusca]